MQGAVRADGRGACHLGTARDGAQRRLLPRRGLRVLREHRLPGPDRRLRGHAGDRPHEEPDRRERDARRAAGRGHRRRHGAAEGPGVAADRARRHHHRRDHANDLRHIRGLGDMAQFKYLAIADDGTKLKATTEARSADALRNELTARQLDVVKISEKRSFNKIEITKQKVKRQEIMHFSRQIGAFVRAGIPLVDALQTVREGTKNERFRDVLQDIAEQIQTGIPFSEALSRHADVFPSYYIGILRSAEITGQLDVVLDQLSLYLERDLEARQKVKSAMTYPAVVFMMSIVTVIILVAFVLPRF